MYEKTQNTLYCHLDFPQNAHDLFMKLTLFFKKYLKKTLQDYSQFIQ